MLEPLWRNCISIIASLPLGMVASLNEELA
jgi:hypothetical protein